MSLLWMWLAACSTEAPPPPEPVVVPKPPPVVVHRYVTASTLNLRSAPEAGDNVLRRLPINTPLKVEGTQGDFANVRTANGQLGWVGAKFLGPEQLTLAQARTQIAKTDSKEEKLAWAQRAAALAPIDEDVLTTLAEQYDANDKAKLAGQVRARLKELSGGRFERCFPSGQRDKIQAFGNELAAVSTLAELKTAREHAKVLSSQLSETLGQLYDWETSKVCGEDDIAWMDPLLPGLQVEWGPEGLGVNTGLSLSDFGEAAKRTPEPEDDAFVALVDKVYSNFDAMGWAAWQMREWDYGGCSTFGSDFHLQVLLDSDALTASPFAEDVKEIRASVIDDIVTDDEEFFPFCTSMGAPSPGEKLMAEIDRILAQVKLTDEERALLEARKKKGFPLNP